VPPNPSNANTLNKTASKLHSLNSGTGVDFSRETVKKHLAEEIGLAPLREE
jgi:hypothetical protein